MFSATAPGAEDFAGLPAAVSGAGDDCITLTGLTPGQDYCWVVRVRDAGGNRDDNTTELCASVPAAACIEYTTVIQPLMDAECTYCHGGGTPLRDLSLESLADVLAGSATGPMVVACDSAGSVLHQKLTPMPPFGLRMPLDGPPYLTPAQIDVVGQWIDEGARMSCADPGPLLRLRPSFRGTPRDRPGRHRPCIGCRPPPGRRWPLRPTPGGERT